MIGPFPIDNFLARFPEFDNEEEYSRSFIANCGQRASMHIDAGVYGMPMVGPKREYATFLVCAHIITLQKQNESGDNGGFGMAGAVYKSTVGSVSVETTKPNTFTEDSWEHYYNLTSYGMEYLALLSVQAPIGVYDNTPDDSVRDLI